MQVDGFRSHNISTVSDQLDAISILPGGYHPDRTDSDYFAMARPGTFSTGWCQNAGRLVGQGVCVCRELGATDIPA
ncbi:MAG: hypothetical protein ACRDRY_24270, partial [Pseudonocardiaceae bacterium]